MAPLPRFTPHRSLGRTGFIATQIGCGDLADRSLPLEQCVATARRALDAGINLIDTAPGYEDGYSEQIVGTALRESRLRDQIFLIDKIDELDAPVMPQIDASLQRLNLDHADAFVLHGLSTMDAWQRAAAPGGSLEQLAAAIRTGKTRFRGISSHHPDVLAAAIPSGLIDIAMFPIGPFVHARYITEILPLAKKHGIASVCFKTFGAGKLLGDTEGYQRPLSNRPRGKISSGGTDVAPATLPRLSVEECLHYTLTLDPDVALLGMSFPNEQDAAFAAAISFTTPLSAERMQDIRRRAIIAMEGKGRCWWNPNESEEAPDSSLRSTVADAIHIVYLDDCMLLTKQAYSNWREIQDEYADYTTSLGPWPVEDVIDFLVTDFKDVLPSEIERIRRFAVSQEIVLKIDPTRKRENP